MKVTHRNMHRVKGVGILKRYDRGHRIADVHRAVGCRPGYTVGAMQSRMEGKEKSAEVLSEALVVYRALPEQEDRYLAECVRLYANVLWALGRTNEEEPYWREYLGRTPQVFLHDLEARTALWRLGKLMQLKAVSGTESATTAALFEESANFFRRAMAAECENWSGTHPNLSEDFQAITSLLASKADATELASAAKKLTEIIEPDDSDEAAKLIARLAALGELLADMERHPHAAGLSLD